MKYLLPIFLILLGCNDKKQLEDFHASNIAESSLVASWKGGSLSMGQLQQGIETEIYEKERELYEMKMDHLKLKLIDSFMKQDERKKNLSNDDYLEKFILEKSDKTVAPKELDKFIADKKMSEEMITAQFKERAREYILMEKRTKALENWLLKKMGEKEGKIFLKKPARPSVDEPVLAGIPYWGKKDAKLKFIFFSDFQCPHSARVHRLFLENQKELPADVGFYYWPFPLPFHSRAKLAAEFAFCAFEFGGSAAFREVYNNLFAIQHKLTPEEMWKAVKIKGIDQQKMKKCIDGHMPLEMIEDFRQKAIKMGIKATPTILLNKSLVYGIRNWKDIQDVIAEFQN